MRKTNIKESSPYILLPVSMYGLWATIYHHLRKPCPVKDLFRRKTPTIALGRWNVEQCEKKTGSKADWANEDHCGPCGEKAQSKPVISKPEDVRNCDSK